ncbi:Cps2E [Rhodopirellula maiorica SM1]|uniref:Cps2E n=1 Tax=Rhodopirellula maiorica SM1 TaxID=1265738 RepID=M5S4K7_9BACT|nr:sugar transferase [Rhodopirellula maiorica]EMI21124.1 Cps2E [Rhodopirellula maiorica SM1]
MLKLISRYATNYTTRRRINTWILTGREFDREIARERARTVRRNIPFCVLKIELCGGHRTTKNTRSLAKLVRRNVRMSDEKGHINRFTIGVLLVDTPEMGGRIVMDRLNGLLSTAHLKAEISLSVYDPQSFNNDDSDDSSANGGDPKSGGTKVRLHDKHPVGRDRRRFHDDELIGSGTRMATPHSSEAFDLMSTRVSNVSFQVDSIIKRTFDVTVASVGLLFAAPVIALAATVIKRDGGPAFFLQSREGRDGVPFTIYKLRTMVVNAESQQAGLRDKSERDGPAFKMRNDPRVTRFGQLLRSTCVDELPQLWNVLRGDMSIVGPRPLPVSESRACQPWHRRRLDVRPGITCNWQVAKEKADTFDEWMRMDLAYVDNANLWKDVSLMAQTVGVPLRAKGSR